jgi:hypothetical protein
LFHIFLSSIIFSTYFRTLYDFSRIINKIKNQKTPPHNSGPDSAHGPGTAGLAHNNFGLAGLANDVTCAHGGDSARSGRGGVVHRWRPGRQGLADHDWDTSVGH